MKSFGQGLPKIYGDHLREGGEEERVVISKAVVGISGCSCACWKAINKHFLTMPGEQNW